MTSFITFWVTFWLTLSVVASGPASAVKKPSNAPASSAKNKAIDTNSFLLGSEVLAKDGFKSLSGKRVGLLTNPSGINHQSQSIVDVLLRANGVKLAALFAPEHGLDGAIPAGQEFPNSMDPKTGLPMYSLYGPGPTRKPTAAMLKGLDVLIYDLQDAGCRSYTFISTMGLAMESCAQAGVEFWVLDRPNPLGGERVEGPMLNPKFRSLVGQWEIPYVYGLTCGELARMINREGWISRPCRLTVVPMRGWRRSMTWKDTGLKWVPTSPHIPRGESPLCYVSTGLLGTVGGVNLGFEYKLPFECIMAPWLDEQKLSWQLNSYGLRGVKFVPFTIRQGPPKYPQNGVRIEFSEPARAPLTAVNYYALDAIKKLTGRDLFMEAVKAGRDFSIFDKVNGTDAPRKALLAKQSAASIVNSWKPGEEAFRAKRQKYLLY